MVNSNLDIDGAYETLRHVVFKTPLQYHTKLSERLKADIYLKREDLQVVRSYKLRGAFNLIQSLTEAQRGRGGCRLPRSGMGRSLRDSRADALLPTSSQKEALSVESSPPRQ